MDRNIGMLKQNNKIILTGANGLIGSFLYNRFNKKYTITSSDYNKGLAKDNFFTLDLTQEEDVAFFC